MTDVKKHAYSKLAWQEYHSIRIPEFQSVYQRKRWRVCREIYGLCWRSVWRELWF